MTINELLNQPVKARYPEGDVLTSAYDSLGDLIHKAQGPRRVAVPSQEQADMLIGYLIVTGLTLEIRVDEEVDYIYRRMAGVP